MKSFPEIFDKLWASCSNFSSTETFPWKWYWRNENLPNKYSQWFNKVYASFKKILNKLLINITHRNGAKILSKLPSKFTHKCKMWPMKTSKLDVPILFSARIYNMEGKLSTQNAQSRRSFTLTCQVIMSGFWRYVGMVLTLNFLSLNYSKFAVECDCSDKISQKVHKFGIFWKK